ncbi:hypothetical protein GCM10008995_25810 [Halobellus salinus]|uniref:Uncharacterized protein n=1 Tax=Halobellus salinus TaxID=931585 RepID=A0A830EVM1_9EURY|nr:hypothetical protein [Halobellus salinus]GGJ14769.1 hypothetical protein GCM10008995_25810 [Halobellus salinus]SMP15515.1 hypothetical protein SAMN06265347_105147 [Halobellus salinus]
MIFGAILVWLLTWGFVGVSIIVATTSGAPAGTVDAVVQSVGGFYLTAVRTLRQFASATTVSPRWVDVAYAALASIPLFIHLLVLWIATTIDSDDGVSNFTIGLTFFVALGAPLGAAVFYLGAQLLTIAVISIGVVFVPMVYTIFVVR